VAIRLEGQVVVKCEEMPTAASLCCPMSPSMIHENLSHRFSGKGQEMGSAMPINMCLTDELQVGFVNQRGRLKSMVLSFPVQVSRGKCSQFGVDVRKQLLSGMVVPWFEFLRELSDPGRLAGFHGRPTDQWLSSSFAHFADNPSLMASAAKPNVGKSRVLQIQDVPRGKEAEHGVYTILQQFAIGRRIELCLQ